MKYRAPPGQENSAIRAAQTLSRPGPSAQNVSRSSVVAMFAERSCALMAGSMPSMLSRSYPMSSAGCHAGLRWPPSRRSANAFELARGPQQRS